MFSRILIVAEPSEQCAKALPVAIDIAHRYRAELHVAVLEPVPLAPISIREIEDARAHARSESEPIIERAKQLARLKDVLIVTHVITGRGMQGLEELIATCRLDLLVVGSSLRRGFLQRLVAGAWRLAHNVPCPVLLVK
jgi:nucleotide-binding universal stress UspA family protein